MTGFALLFTRNVSRTKDNPLNFGFVLDYSPDPGSGL